MAEMTLWVPDSVRMNGAGTNGTNGASATRGIDTQLLEARLREAGMTMTDLMLQVDTAGFIRLGSDRRDMLDLPGDEREGLIKRSRLYWQHEPLPDRIISTWTEWAFGRGWTIKAEDEAFQSVLEEVVAARYNRRQFGRVGWQKHSNALLVDGERIFVFWLNPLNQEIRVRTLDPLEVKDILTNPDDRDEIWYYRRVWRDMDGKEHMRFYQDWDLEVGAGGKTPRHPRMKQQTGDPEDSDYNPVQNAFIGHVTINSLGLRGFPLLTSALDWVRGHREFMRDRSGIQAARHQFAWKGIVKGTQSQVNAVKTAFDSPDPWADPSQGMRTPRAQVFWGNEGIDLQQMSMQSDAAGAQEDGRAFRNMAALPGGLPDFLLGDTGQANLATAKATERPLDTMFGAYQILWVEFIEDMAIHVAEWKGFSGNSNVIIDPPSILAPDYEKTANAIAKLTGVIPGVAMAPQVVQMALTDLGVDDVEGAMAIITPLLQMPPEPQPFGGSEPGGGEEEEVSDEEMEAAIEALRRRHDRSE